jgi:asparagine synthetase B (glutamine-hydrolysing)
MCMMDRSEEVVLIVLLVALVGGMFAFAGWDTVKVPSAEVNIASTLRGANDAERAAVSFGTMLTAKVISGVLVSLIVVVGIFMYQAGEIRRLKNGGWDRFWSRRTMQMNQSKTKKPSLTELLTAIIAHDVMKRKD